MNDPEYPPALRDLQPAALQALHHRPQAQQGALAAQLASNLSGLDNTENFQRRLQAELNGPSHGQQHLQPVNAFDPNRHLHPSPSNAALQTPRQQQHAEHAGGQFGVLTPESGLAARNAIQHATVGRLQQDANPFQTPEQTGAKGEGHFQNMKMVPDPPNLEDWRQKLFDVNEMITLTEDEFQIYFPHVDNIYSHRSTQRYKRKPFVSHYWDCRLKGRPPGTPKSDDPNKKKRRRTARPRDLCDVKIKITEYFPSEGMGQSFPNPAPSSPSIHVNAATSSNFFAPGQPGGPSLQQQHQSHPMLPPTSSDGIPAPPPGSQGGRFYTIQRVNGNGGNGKGDGIAGPHKHTLEDSDRVKKNSVMRSMLKEDKEKKKAQKTYHKKATGNALGTVKKHSREHELKLFGSCFCPFVQRVWISLEVKGLQYQYIEVDPYKKPESLLEVNPRGLVPALRHGNWGCYESSVLMEYLEDLKTGQPLLPPNDPQLRAHSRLWSDHINRNIIPLFYRTLQAQDAPKQASYASDLKNAITTLVDAAHPTGPFFLGLTISFVDIQFAPWMLRLSRVLKPYRGWPDAEPGTRWARWLLAVDEDEHVKATTSSDDLYLDSYERYAENRPNTSQVAQAVNEGRGLP